MSEPYEQLEHTADLALRIAGRDLRTLFANAAYAMFSQLVDLKSIALDRERHVTVDGLDHVSLIVNWLNELLYLHEITGDVYAVFEIETLSPHKLNATVRGGTSSEVHTVIKAATYHGLEIKETADGLTATIVFDV